MTDRCVARVWSRGSSAQWHRCDRPANGTRSLMGMTGVRRRDDAPVCGIHLKSKWAPEIAAARNREAWLRDLST